MDPFPSESPPSPRTSSVPPALAAGIVIGGKYELVRKLGTGAMGEVWAARHRSLEEEVAIKLVMRDVAHEDGSSSCGRFLLEARLASQLSRKTRHIASVTDHGEDGQYAYLVMELLSGESLDERIARSGPMTLERAAPIVMQIARGLAIAHAEGVVHRDLKPSNVFVTTDEDGRALVKILDFGIAKLRRRLDMASLHKTRRGFLLGTPAYMSPEQARAHGNIDHRTDVWALAVIAYHLLTGRHPFEGATSEDLFFRICRSDATDVREHCEDLPAIASDFFRRAFASRVDERFQSALALAGAFEQLEPLASGGVVSLPPPRPVSVPRPISSGSALDDESVVAAGVPRKRRLLVPAIAAVLVACVLGGTATALDVYFERDPTRAAGLTSPPPPPVAHAPLRTEIPPPAEDPPAMRPQDLP
ncbi:MAG TPA: serine/threonine-protein kinase, partial [Labilithrix sp.]